MPTAVGYPGAFAAAFNASVITLGVASTGVPIDKSIIPSGWLRASSAALAMRSHGKSGNPRASGVNSGITPALEGQQHILDRCWSCQFLQRRLVSRAL